MISITYQALGTKWWIEIFDEIDTKTHTLVRDKCVSFAEQYEQNYSRFKDTSIISLLNRNRKLINPSQEVQTLLAYGKKLFLRSDGHFNILVGHILDARGYDAEYSFISKGTERNTCNPITNLLISDTEISLTCGKVDLGGFGKGYLIDRLSELLKSQGISYFLINGGGDMYATSDRGEPITIYLEHPTEAGQYLLETSLLEQGFAASSSFKRQWVRNGHTFTHIVSDAISTPQASFVKAKTAVEADAFATTTLMTEDNDCSILSKRESFEIARYNPVTKKFWCSDDFL